MIVDFSATIEQEAIISHNGPAFITACPGAGKTRTLVERARIVLADRKDRRGVVFLSFTTAAVGELEMRMRNFGVLQSPIFPSFLGTFDRFLWQFFIAPFGMAGSSATPRLVLDKQEWLVRPHSTMQPLPLGAFDRHTGRAIRQVVARAGFSADRDLTRYEACAREMLIETREKGYVDFEDVRKCVRLRLADRAFASRLGMALASRFREIIVDEAQDCNPEDLEIVQWLRDSTLTVKVICDPNQSIYQFRGGVTDELSKFAESFSACDRLTLSGNFRSTPAICSAIVALRPPAWRSNRDEALGKYGCDQTPVYILAYSGATVPEGIGSTFSQLSRALGIAPSEAPILASTLASAEKASGRVTNTKTSHLTLVLAQAMANYHSATDSRCRYEALDGVHRAVLLVQGRIAAAVEYYRYLIDHKLEDGRWRPEIIGLASALRYVERMGVDTWLDEARALLKPGLIAAGAIGQRLKSHSALADVLSPRCVELHPARTIHSVKGLEFPAVCVVLTKSRVGGILDHLEGAEEEECAEDARKIYVAASRAERLLVVAIPRSNAQRLVKLFASAGCSASCYSI